MDGEVLFVERTEVDQHLSLEVEVAAALDLETVFGVALSLAAGLVHTLVILQEYIQ